MASGLPAAKWNNADITDADFDHDALVAWYAPRGVPWGIRVPIELDPGVDLGAPLFDKRCAALLPSLLRATHMATDFAIRRATPLDLDAYAAVELAHFGGDAGLELRWLTAALGARGFTHWIAVDSAGEPIGVAMTVATDELAGPAAYLSGVARVPAWAGRGLEPALAVTAVQAAFESGATLVHANPDDDEVDWMEQLGFVAVAGFRVRLVRPNSPTSLQRRRCRNAS